MHRSEELAIVKKAAAADGEHALRHVLAALERLRVHRIVPPASLDNTRGREFVEVLERLEL